MLRAWALLLCSGLLAASLGCSRTIQHTGGKCDCDPPPVESVLHPYSGPGAPPPAAVGPYSAVSAPVMPKVIETPVH
jgi:hypothetical protein